MGQKWDWHLFASAIHDNLSGRGKHEYNVQYLNGAEVQFVEVGNFKPAYKLCKVSNE